jgi:hypothetical protein
LRRRKIEGTLEAATAEPAKEEQDGERAEA